MSSLLDWTVHVDQDELRFSHTSTLSYESDTLAWNAGIYLSRGDADLNFDGVGLVGIDGIPFTSLASEKSYTFANFYEINKTITDNLRLHGGFRLQYLSLIHI